MSISRVPDMRSYVSPHVFDGKRPLAPSRTERLRAKTAPAVRRQSYTLTEEERSTFAKLCRVHRYHHAEDLWAFWGRVAASRGLDYKTVIASRYSFIQDGKEYHTVKFTALPFDHGKDWCYPSEIKLPSPQPFNENVAFA